MESYAIQLSGWTRHLGVEERSTASNGGISIRSFRSISISCCVLSVCDVNDDGEDLCTEIR